MADHDDLISQFVGITDAAPHNAEAYLKITDWSLEQAIELFFNSEGADMSGGPPPAASSGAPIVISDDDDLESADIREATRASGGAYDADAEIARKLQEEFYADQQQDEVRAPLPRTRETLVGGYMDEDNDDALYEPPRPVRRPGMQSLFLRGMFANAVVQLDVREFSTKTPFGMIRMSQASLPRSVTVAASPPQLEANPSVPPATVPLPISLARRST